MKNIQYNGCFPSDDIPYVIDGQFGLVCDGNSAETCGGPFGEYLRYNNPHKLSLFIASGLPVLIWDQAAECDFVVNNGLGIAIKSLYDIPKVIGRIEEAQYNQMKKSVCEMGDKLRYGYFTTQALNKVG